MENLDQIFNPEESSFWALLLAVVVIAVSFLIARLVRRRTRSVLQRNSIEEGAASLLARIAGWSVIFIGVVLALSIMGFDLVPVMLLIVLVVAFLVFSGRSLLENWAAGLLLQARGPYEIGDRIDTEGESGYVQETNARSVILRTADGRIVHVPNVEVMNNVLVNRTGEGGVRRSSVHIGVSDRSDFANVQRILVNAASACQGVLSEPHPPTAFISGANDTAIEVEVRFWHNYVDRHGVRSEVMAASIAALGAAGVKMPFPTRELLVSGSIATHHA